MERGLGPAVFAHRFSTVGGFFILCVQDRLAVHVQTSLLSDALKCCHVLRISALNVKFVRFLIIYKFLYGRRCEWMHLLHCLFKRGGGGKKLIPSMHIAS